MIRVICHTGWERAGTCQGQADGGWKDCKLIEQASFLS